MRNGQSKHHRMRGRNRGGKSHNPLTRVYESNGPDVKIRGTANHVAEKYIQLARDATASGDPVAAENYYQHAEHYFRLIAAAQEQFRQSQPFQQQQQPRQDGDESFDDGDEMMQPHSGGGEPHYAPREQQSYPQQQQQRDFQGQPQPRQHGGHQQHQPRHEQRHDNRQPAADSGDVSGLPSFITGGQPQQAQPVSYGQNGQNGQNAHDGQNGGQGDRFPLNRRRRRHRGPHSEMQGQGEEGHDDNQPSE